ncbi:MAG: hypothetical protein D4R65_00400 [Verrucomicrobiaceae bacterium]|nr:MAG: hypothetical protein D4R65_00400 [Verrucomicrobiaceae bacterium]
MKTLSPDRFFRSGIRIALPILSALTLAAPALEAGTWSAAKWTGDQYLPKAAPDSVTHAVVFGIETEPAPPPPFEITKRIAGDNWSVWTYPEHAASVEVTRRPEKLLDSVKMEGSSAALLQGRIVPKGKNKGLSLELTGLQPGKNYNLVLFGPQILIPDSTPGGKKITATASDTPDKPEVLTVTGDSGKYFVYAYTAPDDGQLKIDLENANTEHEIGIARLCAFMNYSVP